MSRCRENAGALAVDVASRDELVGEKRNTDGPAELADMSGELAAVIVALIGAAGTLVSAWIAVHVRRVEAVVNGHRGGLEEQVAALHEEILQLHRERVRMAAAASVRDPGAAPRSRPIS